ncbi:unnamed protein product [Effrenium voratum]|uniref:Phytanoyl-CoA dioxygenase n=1 Tax=Effrenium voratum TaxID=2562239 RepID=A0AA36HQ89_9DINO|nr:unnamed protein product [Effrenium voratum]CAJ1373316.1 unnamed protein product [Effrenium voratum]
MAARGWALPLGAAACGLAVWVALRRRKRAVLALPRLSSDAGASALAAALQRCGVVVVEGLAPELAEQAKRELADKGLQGTFHGAEGSFAGHHTRRNAGKALGESLAAQELAQHPLILEAVEKVLLRWCKRINLGTCSAISVEPPSGNEAPAPPQVLHRDNSMWGASTWPWLPSSSFKGRPEFSVSVMWALSDFTASNGATRFLPGSNHWPAQGGAYGKGVGPLPEEADAVKATMARGSVALWLGNTLHGAGAHSGKEPSARHGLVFIYNLGWLKPEHNFHWAMPPGVLRSFSPKLQELIGLFGQNAVEHEWYTGPVYTQPYLGGPSGSSAGEGVQF